MTDEVVSPAMDVNRTRTWIAFIIIAISIVGVCAISWVALVYVGPDQRPEMSRLVFASVLPLLGTWVGAVLAFYFSRDNLQAGSQTTLAAVQTAQAHLSSNTAAADAMIPYESIRPRQDTDDLPSALALPLSNLAAEMGAAGNARIPVFDRNRVALLVVHQPDIDRYAQDKSMSATSLTSNDTVSELLKDAPTAAAVQGFVAVRPSASVADARQALAKAPAAKDVFVTETGALGGRVLGWLTNSDLARAR